MAFTFPNIYLVVTIGILTIILTFLRTKGDWTTSSTRLLDRLTYRGRAAGVVLLVIFLALIIQEINSQNLSNNRDLKSKQEQDDRDKIITDGIKAGVDSASGKLFDDISLAFKKQGLKIDTLNKKILGLKVIRSRVTNNTIVELEPMLEIPPNNGIVKNKGIYQVSIVSKNAPSTNFNVKSYLLIIFLDKSDKLEKPNIPLYEHIKFSSSFQTRLTKTDKNILGMYLYIEGTYSNLSKTKTYSLDLLNYYSEEENFQGPFLQPERASIIDRIRQLDRIN